MESETYKEPEDVEAAEEQEDKSPEQQHPPAVRDDTSSCYPTFAIVTFWQGRVEIAFRCVLTLILPLGVVIAAAVSIENTFTEGFSTTLPELRPLFRWLITVSIIHMIYEGTVLCIRFLKTLFLKWILITDIVVSVILMGIYIGTGPPVVKYVRDIDLTRCSGRVTLIAVTSDCTNFESVHSAGIAACVFIYLIIVIYIPKIIWNYLFLRHKWNRFVENSKPMPCFKCCK